MPIRDDAKACLALGRLAEAGEIRAHRHVRDQMLAHRQVHRRPQSLNRYPNGIHEKSFYQKDVTGKVPEWVHTFLYHANNEPEDKHFLVVDDEASILLMASLGTMPGSSFSPGLVKVPSRAIPTEP